MSLNLLLDSDGEIKKELYKEDLPILENLDY